MDNSYCCVPQCNSHGSKVPRTSFHRFPPATERKGIRRMQWIAKLRIGREVSDRMVVCGKHFKPYDFFPVTAGENGLKRRILKKNAVPSLNLPTDDLEYEYNTKLKKTKKSKSNNKALVSERTFPEKRKSVSFNETSSQNFFDDLEKVKNKTYSSLFDDIHEKCMNVSPYIKQFHEVEHTEDQGHEINETILPITLNSDHEIYEEQMDATPCISRLNAKADDYLSNDDNVTEQQMDVAPCISRLHVKADDYLPNDDNVTELSSEKLEDNAQISTVPSMPVQSEFDYSIFKSSPDDSKETLTEKLDSMISVNELLQKKLKFYKNKCKLYEKEVNIMKGVIENLKLINSVTYDN